MDEKISIIAENFAKGGKNIVFTGAGVSTESGIPDYRSKGGIWDRYRPVYFDEFMSSKEARIEYWKEKSELYPDLKKAKPNPAHTSIAQLYELGLIEAIITQNIDGLHQKAGLPDEKVIELHGNTCRVRCMSCRELSSIDDAQRRIDESDLAPECECGGYLKPDTISFGQAMPVEEMTKAMNLSQECDSFMVIGSTLVVQPAATLPGLAKQNGAFLAIINLSETPCDNLCNVLIKGKAGEILPEIVNEVKKII
jgi:NAD-dependent deacetylase